MKNILTSFVFVSILLCVGLGCGRLGLTGTGYTVFSHDELQKAQEAILKESGTEGMISQVFILEESLELSVINSENPLLGDSYIFDANGLKADKLGEYKGKASSERIFSIGDIDLTKAMDFIEKTKQLIKLPDGKAFSVSITREDFFDVEDYRINWHVGIKDGSSEGFAVFHDDGKVFKAVRDSEVVFEGKKPEPATAIKTDEDTTPATGVPKRISMGVVNGKAIKLPQPEYPAAARAVNAKGSVNVIVVIDLKGDVISAKASSGHPLLRKPAEEAARLAEFKPTSVSKQPVEVSGVIVYIFK